MWKKLRDLGNGQNIWEMAQIDGTRIQYLRSGLTMFEMASEFDKRFKYV